MGLRRDLERVRLHAFQQPFRCCNLTAVAFALSALGHGTTLDDIVHTLRVPIGTLLDDGMTLAETFDACLAYIERTRLPLQARHRHFDHPDVTLEWFARELQAGSRSDADIHILNFNARIAHDHPGLEGGHFALLADFDTGTGMATIADTNPKRYSRFWSCPVERLYAACADRDTVADRARGMIVVGRSPPTL